MAKSKWPTLEEWLRRKFAVAPSYSIVDRSSEIRAMSLLNERIGSNFKKMWGSPRSLYKGMDYLYLDGVDVGWGLALEIKQLGAVSGRWGLDDFKSFDKSAAGGVIIDDATISTVSELINRPPTLSHTYFDTLFFYHDENYEDGAIISVREAMRMHRQGTWDIDSDEPAAAYRYYRGKRRDVFSVKSSKWLMLSDPHIKTRLIAQLRRASTYWSRQFDD